MFGRKNKFYLCITITKNVVDSKKLLNEEIEYLF